MRDCEGLSHSRAVDLIDRSSTVQMPSAAEWDKAVSPLLQHSTRWRSDKVNEIMCLLAGHIKVLNEGIGLYSHPSEELLQSPHGLLVCSMHRMMQTLEKGLTDMFRKLEEVQAGLYAVEADLQSDLSPLERLQQDLLRAAREMGIRMDGY